MDKWRNYGKKNSIPEPNVINKLPEINKYKFTKGREANLLLNNNF